MQKYSKKSINVKSTTTYPTKSQSGIWEGVVHTNLSLPCEGKEAANDRLSTQIKNISKQACKANMILK